MRDGRKETGEKNGLNLDFPDFRIIMIEKKVRTRVLLMRVITVIKK